MIKKIFFTLLFISLFSVPSFSEVFSHLEQKILKENRYDSKLVRKIFSDQRIRFVPRAVEINLTPYPTHHIYPTFLSDKNISIASSFFKKNKKTLSHWEKKMGVDKEVVVGILLVETKCGLDRSEGYAVWNVYSSLAIANEPQFIKKNLKKALRKGMNKKKAYRKLNRRAKRKQKWGYRQLLSLLKVAQKNKKLDILSLRGSWAGAWGLPQFLPSSYLSYGLDGNDDGIVDLFDVKDAIASTMNYLKKNGWKKGLSEKKKAKVVWKYNHSDDYVNTVLKIAKRLKNKKTKTSSSKTHHLKLPKLFPKEKKK